MASTPAYVKRVTGQVGTGPVLYRDQILDAGFVGDFDFVSDYVRNGIAPGASIPVGSSFRNLVKDGAAALVEGFLAGPFTGGFDSKGLKAQAANNKLKLPDSFRLPTTSTHFAFCVWTSYETAISPLPANGQVSFGGYAYQNGPYNQYVIAASTDANRAVVALRFYVDAAVLIVTDPAVLAKVADGAMHQYVVEGEVINNGTQWRITGFMDGAQVGQNTFAFDGALNDPVAGNAQANVSGPYLGQVGGFTMPYGHFGRCWMKRFSLDPTNRPIAEIVAQEWAAYKNDFV